MPTYSLNAVSSGPTGTTPSVATGAGSYSMNVSGTFVGTVRFERLANPADQNASWQPIAKDMAGNFVEFTAPSGDFPGQGVTTEGDAQIRARLTAYTSGTVVVRIGR